MSEGQAIAKKWSKKANICETKEENEQALILGVESHEFESFMGSYALTQVPQISYILGSLYLVMSVYSAHRWDKHNFLINKIL